MANAQSEQRENNGGDKAMGENITMKQEKEIVAKMTNREYRSALTRIFDNIHENYKLRYFYIFVTEKLKRDPGYVEPEEQTAVECCSNLSDYGKLIIDMVHEIDETDTKFLMQVYTIMRRHIEKEANSERSKNVSNYDGSIIKMLNGATEKQKERLYHFISSYLS